MGEVSRLLSHPQARPLQSRYPDILFARLYAIINDGFDSAHLDEPFTAASLESLGPEHLRYATRLSVIIEAVSLLCVLHADAEVEEFETVEELTPSSLAKPTLAKHFLHKGSQIARQVRKSAESARNYTGAAHFPPAHLNGLLNEIALIEELLAGQPFKTLSREREAWRSHARKLESLYLSTSMATSLAQDRVNSTGPFPVSTCIDEIFYCFKTTLGRSPENASLVIDSARSLLSRINDGLQQERSLLPFLILLNNALQCRSHYTVLMDGKADAKSSDLDLDLDRIIQGGIERLYAFICPAAQLPSTVPELISALQPALPSILTQTLAPAGLEAFYLQHAKQLSTALMTALLELKQKPASSLFLLLHPQLQALTTTATVSDNPQFQCSLLKALKRPQQAISLLDAGEEFDAILADLKEAGELELRAGEVLQLRSLLE